MRRLADRRASLVLVPIIEIAVADRDRPGDRRRAGRCCWCWPLGARRLAAAPRGSAGPGGRSGPTWTSGRPPGNAATDGLLALLGGVFMLVPGFVSDVVGGCC